LSVESGTLTRTMKPRRQQIMQVYSQQVEQLLRKLRG
jgi:long-subunit acyl-CoA synthetase (AMP-forming)